MLLREGGCYCGKVRYEAEGEPILRAECHCPCQYFSGGAANMFILMPPELPRRAGSRPAPDDHSRRRPDHRLGSPRFARDDG